MNYLPEEKTLEHNGGSFVVKKSFLQNTLDKSCISYEIHLDDFGSYCEVKVPTGATEDEFDALILDGIIKKSEELSTEFKRTLVSQFPVVEDPENADFSIAPATYQTVSYGSYVENDELEETVEEQTTEKLVSPSESPIRAAIAEVPTSFLVAP